MQAKLKVEVPIVFQHLPKTGGTSLHSHLVKSFEPSRVCPERFNKLARFTPEELASFDFFSGHFSKDSISLIPSGARIVTLFRDPKERILSLYYFWKSHAANYVRRHGLVGPAIARERDLLGFLREKDQRIAQHINNAYALNIVGHEKFNELKTRGASCEAIAGIAINEVRRFSCYGILERFPESLERICSTLNIDMPDAVPWKMRLDDDIAMDPNREKVFKEEITEEVAKRLELLTSVDSIIYEYILNGF